MEFEINYTRIVENIIYHRARIDTPFPGWWDNLPPTVQKTARQ